MTINVSLFSRKTRHNNQKLLEQRGNYNGAIFSLNGLEQGRLHKTSMDKIAYKTLYMYNVA